MQELFLAKQVVQRPWKLGGETSQKQPFQDIGEYVNVLPYLPLYCI